MGMLNFSFACKKDVSTRFVDAKGRNYAVLVQKGRIYAVTSLLH